MIELILASLCVSLVALNRTLPREINSGKTNGWKSPLNRCIANFFISEKIQLRIFSIKLNYFAKTIGVLLKKNKKNKTWINYGVKILSRIPRKKKLQKAVSEYFSFKLTFGARLRCIHFTIYTFTFFWYWNLSAAAVVTGAVAVAAAAEFKTAIESSHLIFSSIQLAKYQTYRQTTLSTRRAREFDRNTTPKRIEEREEKKRFVFWIIENESGHLRYNLSIVLHPSDSV